MAEDQAPRITSSGIEIDSVYRGPTSHRLSEPGEYPFTRGPYPTMYRGRPWTMRQYAGFGTAEETNARFRSLLEAGQTGLSVAFDLPTQMGLDSDHVRAAGEVGKVGVAVDTIEDMRALLAEIPLGEVTTSMTINATAPLLLLLYQLVAEEQGVPAERIRGTVQNDILKEYIARGTYIYPPRPSMRLVTDLFSYCAAELPSWNTISISGYHIREAGATAAQEIAFTLADGLAYVEAAQDAGLEVDAFAPRLSFFWNAHANFLEEVAKFRAARRLWATLMREQVGAKNPDSWRMRFHTQTAGSTLTAQQPENNIVRTTLQALSAVLGGTQSLHTNAYDEALGLPTDASALLALRTQQIIAEETGITDTVDPLGGSFFVEALTDQLEAIATELLDQIAALGGAVEAIERGFQQSHIEESAYLEARRLEKGESRVVGVNCYTEDALDPIPVLRIRPEVERDQTRRLAEFHRGRNEGAVRSSLSAVRDSADGNTNLLYPMKRALRAGTTIGEISDVLRLSFGEYRPR
ncbi:MAG TPA: methylmalonyl-CoA mutase family protein [Acidimicrobiia bacterium]